MLLQKVHVMSKKIDLNINVSFSCFFLFYRVFGCFSVMGVQKHHKSFLQKHHLVFFTPKSTNKSKADFFSVFFIKLLGVSRWSSKTPLKKKVEFLASDPPTHHGPLGPPTFILAAPWAKGGSKAPQNFLGEVHVFF
jgi:hypothetical protein